MQQQTSGENALPVKCEVIRSSRKTFGLEVKGDRIIARVPFGAEDGQVRDFINVHTDWICRHLQENERRRSAWPDAAPLTMEEIQRLAEKALQVIPERVRFYAPKVGVTYGRITIRNQKTRWGSCSAKGNLNFNCLLMLTPAEVIDSVVVHELCHRREMNHSRQFYQEVYRVYPDYDKWNRWLKENGSAIMSRMR